MNIKLGPTREEKKIRSLSISMKKIVGFQCGHDVSYCILENGVPVINEELERFTREKEPLGDGLEFFFSRANEKDFDFSDIQHFSSGNYRSKKWIKEGLLHPADQWGEKWDTQMNEILQNSKGEFYEIGHHLSHAANAFFTSDFDEALIITIDGGGVEPPDTLTGLTFSLGKDNKIEQLHVFPQKEVNLGGLWDEITEKVFNLSTGHPKGNQCGTVMAMSTLGDAKHVDLIEFQLKGERVEKGGTITNNSINELKRVSEVSEQSSFDVAASLQLYTENTLKSFMTPFMKEHKPKNICLSGGTSLNCVMMGKLKQWFPELEGVFCDPVPYDAGLCIGSARYAWHHILDNPRIHNAKNKSPYLGVTYSLDEVKMSILNSSTEVSTQEADDQAVIDLLDKQKIISVFGGGAESGRRALGNRSILADPRSPKMKDIINEKVKHRQWFRPFAPSILKEYVSEWFEEVFDSPYMSFAVKFKEEKRGVVPAVVHSDGTGRLQTVDKEINPWYHGFIDMWRQHTGVPILLNTSFNDREPIVETPDHAIRCFLNTDIDYLYFFDYGILLSKKNEAEN